MDKTMMFKDRSGQQFGKLVALYPCCKYPKTTKGTKIQWFCKCECGGSTVTLAYALTSGDTTSCGCKTALLNKTRKVTHGMSKSRAYTIWGIMKSRCLNPNNTNFSRYGERGITICDRWLEPNGQGFLNFLADMGEPDEGMTLDRKNNDLGYSPGNCRWATRLEQGNNTSANHLVEFRGKTQSVADWCRELKIPYWRTIGRIQDGWDAATAFTTPALKSKKSS